jgi:beta-phosphoglucomutase-like phosphatase (HAD superfamily)
VTLSHRSLTLALVTNAPRVLVEPALERQSLAIEDSEAARRSAEAAGLRVALCSNKTASDERARPFKRIQRLSEVLDIVA